MGFLFVDYDPCEFTVSTKGNMTVALSRSCKLSAITDSLFNQVAAPIISASMEEHATRFCLQPM